MVAHCALLAACSQYGILSPSERVIRYSRHERGCYVEGREVGIIGAFTAQEKWAVDFRISVVKNNEDILVLDSYFLSLPFVY